MSWLYIHPSNQAISEICFFHWRCIRQKVWGRNVPEAIHSSNKYLLSTYVLGAVLWTKGTKITEIWSLLLRNSQFNEEGGWETVWQVIRWGFAEGVLGAHETGARKNPRTKEKQSVNEQILHKQNITLENISIALWVNDPKWNNWNITFREEAEVSKYCSSGLLAFPIPLSPIQLMLWFLYIFPEEPAPEKKSEKCFRTGKFSKAGWK